MRGHESDDQDAAARHGISAYRLLRAVAGEILVQHDPAQLLARCGDLVQELLQADACSVALLDQRAGTLVPLLTAAGGRSATVAPLPIAQLSGRMLKAIREGRSLTVAHGILIDGAIPIRLAENQSALTAMLIPLPLQGGMHGVLWVGRVHGLPFSSEEQDLAETIAALVALGLRGTTVDRPREAAVMHDPLTGLHTREHFSANLTALLGADTPCALLLLDIDRFAPFNDRYGREAGDALLRAFGTLLNDELRATDSACRYAGDTVAILLPESSHDHAMSVAGRVRDHFAAAAQHLCTTLAAPTARRAETPPTLAVGLAVAPGDATDGAALRDCAEQALQRAQDAGGDRVLFAQEGAAQHSSAAD